jgi:hypothetical protein
MLRTMTVSPNQAVAIGYLIRRPVPGKQIGVAHTEHRGTVFCNTDPFSTGYMGANQVRVSEVMFTQQAERVVVARIYQTLDISGDCCRRIVGVVLQHLE